MSQFFNKNVDYFLKVAATGSFKEASRLLNLSQPALSIAIKNFEEDLRCQLFARKKKNAALTPQGKKLYDRLTSLNQIVSAETTEVLDGEYLPRVRMGSVPWFANLKLLPILKKPEHKMTMDRGQFFFRPAGLLKGAVERSKIDFAFINWHTKPAGVQSTAIQKDPAVIGGLKSKFAHISKAKSYKDLENVKWICSEVAAPIGPTELHGTKVVF